MSLYIPPLYQQIPVFTPDGKRYGTILRPIQMSDGDTLVPPELGHHAAFSAMAEMIAASDEKDHPND